MNGAESLVHSLLKSGVTTCFSNPGTSEMHFVAALDRVPGMHCVLGLFEGVVTGAADFVRPLRAEHWWQAHVAYHGGVALGPRVVGGHLAGLQPHRRAMGSLSRLGGRGASWPLAIRSILANGRARWPSEHGLLRQ